MRWLVTAVFLSVLSLGIFGGYVYQTQSELKAFCETLPLDATIAQVREAARDRGFEPHMEPYTQMRIEPALWPAAPPACRVFFNKASHTVEYRSWQKS